MIGLEARDTMGRCAIIGINAAVNQACAATANLRKELYSLSFFIIIKH